ncbi:hypothetical protein, partial [Klebsiella pneumoniae]|uniref:hypothetical protein n=1 Tax=Klebsiella pneumoniae TaxID=573 RepID=UPI0029DC57E4
RINLLSRMKGFFIIYMSERNNALKRYGKKEKNQYFIGCGLTPLSCRQDKKTKQPARADIQ